MTSGSEDRTVIVRAGLRESCLSFTVQSPVHHRMSRQTDDECCSEAGRRLSVAAQTVTALKRACNRRRVYWQLDFERHRNCSTISPLQGNRIRQATTPVGLELR